MYEMTRAERSAAQGMSQVSSPGFEVFSRQIVSWIGSKRCCPIHARSSSVCRNRLLRLIRTNLEVRLTSLERQGPYLSDNIRCPQETEEVVQNRRRSLKPACPGQLRKAWQIGHH